MKKIDRRTALTAGLAAPMAILASQKPAAAVAIPAFMKNARKAKTAEFFGVPPEGALIGLLLPAVQRLRESAARLQLIDSSGEIGLELPIPDQDAPHAAFFRLRSRLDRGAGVVVDVEDSKGNPLGEISTGDGVLMALLVPAVQKGPGMLAGSVQLFGDGSVKTLLPFIEQDNFFRSNRGGHHFAGPLQLTSGQTARIGLLLPAVQRIREPARYLLVNSQAAVIAEAQVSTEGKPESMVATWLEQTVENGSATLSRRLPAGGSEVLGGGACPDGILIGLLLPAVQRPRVPVPLIGGGVIAPDTTIGFTDTSG
jgi:hypothetical protein